MLETLSNGGRYTRRMTYMEEPDVLARVKELADEAGTTPSAWIRQATRERLRATEDA